MTKPLGHKSYTSIGHLPGSRMNSNLDHLINPGQAKICTVAQRDKHDFIIVQEKLDGSNVAICNIDGALFPVNRSGHLAITSPYKQHHLFHNWVHERYSMFLSAIKPGERLCGEWLAQAHGTRYDLKHDPFVAFDIMFNKHERMNHVDFNARLSNVPIVVPTTIAVGPTSVETAKKILSEHNGFHGAIDKPEGAVWRVERHGKVDFLAKFVDRLASEDGKYLPEMSGKDAVWNWNYPDEM